MIARCTAKVAQDRYATSAALVAELDALGPGGGANAEPPKPDEKMKPAVLIRRGWLAVPVVAITGGALAIALHDREPDSAQQPVAFVSEAAAPSKLEQRRLTAGLEINAVELSPDGKSIVYVDSTGIYLIDVATGGRRQLPMTSSRPGWMPDSSPTSPKFRPWASAALTKAAM